MWLFKIIVIFILFLLSYYLYGVFYNYCTKCNNNGITLTLIKGLCLYNVVFMVFAIPLKYIQNPLHLTALYWSAFWIISNGLIIVVFRNRILLPIKKSLSYLKTNRLLTLLFIFFTSAQIIFIELFGRWSGSNNPSDYQGYVSVAVFKDVLGVYDGRMGYKRSAFDYRQFTQCVLDQSAIVSKVFNIHYLLEVRWILPAIMLLFFNLIVFLTARSVIKNNKEKQWLFYVTYITCIIVQVGSTLLQGYYIYFRSYEGKNGFSAITIPLLFYCIWKLYENPRDNDVLLLAFIAGLSSFFYNGIGLFTIPIMAIGLLPSIFSKKYFFRTVVNGIVFILPSIIYAAYFYSYVKNIISYSIK